MLPEDEDRGGQEIILAYLNGGDFIGEIGLFYRSGNRSTRARARSDCKLAQIRYTALNGRLETELEDVHVALLHAVSQLSFMNVAGRVAHTLLVLREAPKARSRPE